MQSLLKTTALIAALLAGHATAGLAAAAESSATIVEFETPLAALPTSLQGVLRRPNTAAPCLPSYCCIPAPEIGDSLTNGGANVSHRREYVTLTVVPVDSSG